MNGTIDIPAGGPLFAGHFPGRPILPAVALLALIATALDVGPNMSVRSIQFLRLRQPVAPGDRLHLSARDARGGTRVDLRRDAMLIANGELTFGHVDQGAALPQQHVAPPCTNPVSDGASIGTLLPHRPPMRFVHSVVERTATSLACTVRIPVECALVTDGSAPALAAIEAAAQTAAVWEALRRREQGEPSGARLGYLVALRDLELYVARVPANETMVAAVELTAMALPLTHYAVEVSLGGTRVLRGTVATFLTDEAIS